MPKETDRTVTWGEGKLPRHKFKSKKCHACGKKRVLDTDSGEWCWYCGQIITLKED